MLPLLQAIAAISIIIVSGCRLDSQLQQQRNVVYEGIGGFAPCAVTEERPDESWCVAYTRTLLGFTFLQDSSGNRVLASSRNFAIELAMEPMDKRFQLCIDRKPFWINRLYIPRGYLFAIGDLALVPCSVAGEPAYGRIK